MVTVMLDLNHIILLSQTNFRSSNIHQSIKEKTADTVHHSN